MDETTRKLNLALVARNAATGLEAIHLVAQALGQAHDTGLYPPASLNDPGAYLRAGMHVFEQMTGTLSVQLDDAVGANAHTLEGDSPEGREASE